MQTSVNMPDIQNASVNTRDKTWNYGDIFKPSLQKGYTIEDETSDEEPSSKIDYHIEDASSPSGNEEAVVSNELETVDVITNEQNDDDVMEQSEELINVSKSDKNESQTGSEISPFVRKFVDPVENVSHRTGYEGSGSQQFDNYESQGFTAPNLESGSIVENTGRLSLL